MLFRVYIRSHSKKENNYKKISPQIVVSKQSFIAKYEKLSTVPHRVERKRDVNSFFYGSFVVNIFMFLLSHATFTDSNFINILWNLGYFIVLFVSAFFITLWRPCHERKIQLVFNVTRTNFRQLLNSYKFRETEKFVEIE